MKGHIPMNAKELERIPLFETLLTKRLKISKAAKHPGLGVRQVKRLKKQFKVEEPGGLISKKLRLPGNRRLFPENKARIVAFSCEPDHSDFGPTLTHEYLLQDGTTVTVSVSFVRRTMPQEGFRHPKKKRLSDEQCCDVM